MKIELKSVKVFEEMSEETTAFVADVFVNGKKVAYAKNDGRGGETYYHAYPNSNTGDLLNEAEEYCKGLPPREWEYGGQSYSFDQNLTFVIDELLEKKEEEKFIKKRDKECVKAFVYGTKNFYQSLGYKKVKDLKEVNRITLQKTYDKVKEEIKGTNKQIFNSEEQLESLGIKI